MMITDEMIEAVKAELLAHGEFGSSSAASEQNAEIAAKAVLEIALSASPAGVVKTKPLEWDEPKKPDLYCSYDYMKANGAGLTYQIEWKSWKSYPGYCVYAGENMVGTFDTLEAAKDAAFADYSARIMSAIEPAGVGVETLASEMRDRMIADMNELIEFLSENPDNIYHLDAEKVEALRAALTKEATHD